LVETLLLEKDLITMQISINKQTIGEFRMLFNIYTRKYKKVKL
jgi:hypothetical protein